MTSGWVLHRAERYGQQVVGNCSGESPFVETESGDDGLSQKPEALLMDSSAKSLEEQNAEQMGSGSTSKESQVETEKAELNI
jgi:hypothetical protein